MHVAQKCSRFWDNDMHQTNHKEKISLHPIWMRDQRAFGRPGSDLLSRVLRRSTISAGAFHGRVRNGIGCSRSAITTRSAKRTLFEKLFERRSTKRHRQRSCRVPLGAVRWSLLRLTSLLFGVMGIRNENDQADRTISTGKLQALPLFHTRPINVVVFHGSQGILVLRWVSRLDAFSGYPVRI
jgi:hypothetical protein